MEEKYCRNVDVATASVATHGKHWLSIAGAAFVVILKNIICQSTLSETWNHKFSLGAAKIVQKSSISDDALGSLKWDSVGQVVRKMDNIIHRIMIHSTVA